MSNNFDMCSYGVGIDCNLYYDSMLGRIQFEENFTTLGERNAINEHSYFYIDFGNIETPNKLGDIIKIDKPANISKTFMDDMFDVVTICNAYSNYDIEEIYSDMDKYYDVLSQDILNADISFFDEVIVYDCIKLKDNVLEYVTKGYSQGDATTVYLDFNKLNETWGTDININGTDKKVQKTIKEITDEIDHFFWDSPIGGYINVIDGGTEVQYEVEDILKDPYEYDKDIVKEKVLSHVKEKFTLTTDKEERFKQDLDAVLPTHLSVH